MKKNKLKSLLNTWDYSINWLESNYGKSVYTYLRILETRDSIEQAINNLDLDEQSEIKDVIDSLDQRFVETTVSVEQPVRGKHAIGLWWWYRIPQKFQISKELQLFPGLILDIQDQKALEEITHSWSRVASISDPIQRLEVVISGWISFVISVKHTYKLDVDSYTNSLNMRYLLTVVCDNLSEKGKNEVLEILKPVDEIFIAVTVPISLSSRAFPGSLGNKSSWWHRIPCYLSEKIERQFALLGIFS